MVSEDLKNRLDRLLKVIYDLQKSYTMLNDERSKLHVRYADVYSKEPLYELSINYELLDDFAQADIREYLEDYYVSLGATEKYDDQPLGYYGKVIKEEHVEIVKEKLGIPNTLNLSEFENVFDKLVEKYDELFDLIISEFDKTQVREEYFGTSYYPRLKRLNYGFAIDNDYIYLIDYQTEIPTIYTHDSSPILEKAIKFSCYSEDQLDFYRVH